LALNFYKAVNQDLYRAFHRYLFNFPMRFQEFSSFSMTTPDSYFEGGIPISVRYANICAAFQKHGGNLGISINSSSV